jgi:hypothetical protein
MFPFDGAVLQFLFGEIQKPPADPFGRSTGGWSGRFAEYPCSFRNELKSVDVRKDFGLPCRAVQYCLVTSLTRLARFPI